MTQETVISPDLQSIVIVGAMNPSIHHPSWYKIFDLISPDELSFALEKEQCICTSQVTRFRIPAFEIICQDERWEIKTFEKGARDRILDVACRVFKLLDHTPVRACGHNSILFHKTSLNSVHDFLSTKVLAANIGFVRGDKNSAEIHFKSWSGDTETNVRVAPHAQEKDVAQIYVNSHRKIVETGHFDLEPILRVSFKHHSQEVEKQVESIKKSLVP